MRKETFSCSHIYLGLLWEHFMGLRISFKKEKNTLKLSIPPLDPKVHVHFSILFVPRALVVVVVVLVVLIIIVIVIINGFLVGFSYWRDVHVALCDGFHLLFLLSLKPCKLQIFVPRLVHLFKV